MFTQSLSLATFDQMLSPCDIAGAWREAVLRQSVHRQLPLEHTMQANAAFSVNAAFNPAMGLPVAWNEMF